MMVMFLLWRIFLLSTECHCYYSNKLILNGYLATLLVWLATGTVGVSEE